MLQLHLSDEKFYCLLRCNLYWRFNGTLGCCRSLNVLFILCQDICKHLDDEVQYICIYCKLFAKSNFIVMHHISILSFADTQVLISELSPWQWQSKYIYIYKSLHPCTHLCDICECLQCDSILRFKWGLSPWFVCFKEITSADWIKSVFTDGLWFQDPVLQFSASNKI